MVDCDRLILRQMINELVQLIVKLHLLGHVDSIPIDQNKIEYRRRVNQNLLL
jgi:hypothetical protein